MVTLTSCLIDKDKLYWSSAIEACLKSKMTRFQIGASLVKKGEVISTGYNSKKTHPEFGSKKYKTLHAEGYCLYNAIRKDIDVSDSTMYIFRRNGLNAKPCSDCVKLLEKYGVSVVYYSNHERRPSKRRYRQAKQSWILKEA